MKNVKIILFISYMLFSISCKSQSNLPSNTSEILISKNWILEGVENYKHKIKFTGTKMTVFSNDTIIGEEDYYLSNELGHCEPSSFIQANVGVITIGKYIITKKLCMEIKNISNSKLEIKNVKTRIICFI